MTDRQEAKLNMYHAVSETCHKNEQLYTGVPVVVDTVKQLDDSLAAIGKNAGQQSAPIPKAASAEKIFSVDNMAHVSLKVANALYVYALNTGDKILLSIVSVNKSMFYNRHYFDVLTQAKSIAAEVHKHASELSAYGIDEVSIKELDEAIEGFEQVINKPLATINERKLYTDNLKQLFAETDSILYDRLDKLIILFKTSYPEFYFLYKTSRNVIDTAKRSRKTEEATTAN